jgi:hypothetical protein
MEEFWIRFLDKWGSGDLSGTRFGEIKIGHFRETFLADVASYWDEKKYETQWMKALSNILIGERSALITQITDPSNSNFIRWWAMYHEGDVVRFQDEMIFLEQLSGPFDPNEVERFVRPRMTITEEGDEISEWCTTTSSVRAFLHDRI